MSYTISEIDRMRKAVKSGHFPSMPLSSRTYSEASIEDLLKTYVMAGVRHEELEHMAAAVAVGAGAEWLLYNVRIKEYERLMKHMDKLQRQFEGAL